MVEMAIEVRKSETKQRKSAKVHNKICVTKLNSKEYNWVVESAKGRITKKTIESDIISICQSLWI